MTSYRKAIIYALLAMLCWSTVAAAFKKTLFYLHQNTLLMLLYSSAVSCIILFIVLYKRDRLESLKTSAGKQLFFSAALGMVNPVLYYLVLFKAYAILPGQEAQPLNYTWPIVFSVLAVPILKQRMTRFTWISLLISFSGVLIIATRGHVQKLHFTNIQGVLLAVGSSLLWALYWIFQLRDKRDAVVKLFYNFLFGFVYILTLYFILHSRIEGISLFAWIGCIWIGIFEMGLAFIFWLRAIEYAPNVSSVGQIVYLSPFISLIFLAVIVGEAIHVSSVIGLILIIGGILLQRKSQPEL